MVRLSRDFSVEATRILIGVASDPAEETRCRLVAVEMLLTRAWGKSPPSHEPTAEESQRDLEQAIARLSVEQRAQLYRALAAHREVIAAALAGTGIEVDGG